jgi:hypothetical protein
MVRFLAGVSRPHNYACTAVSLTRFPELQSGWSFAAESDISHADSDRTVTFRPSKTRQINAQREWLRACEEAWDGGAPHDSTLNEDVVSEATSHWSTFSASTIRAGGEWINPAPRPLR